MNPKGLRRELLGPPRKGMDMGRDLGYRYNGEKIIGAADHFNRQKNKPSGPHTATKLFK